MCDTGKQPVRREFDDGLLRIEKRAEEIEEACVAEDKRFVMSFLKLMKEHFGLPCPSRLVIRNFKLDLPDLKLQFMTAECRTAWPFGGT